MLQKLAIEKIKTVLRPGNIGRLGKKWGAYFRFFLVNRTLGVGSQQYP